MPNESPDGVLASDGARPARPAERRWSATAWTLTGAIAGLALGALLHGSADPWVAGLTGALTSVGQLWVAALRVTVLPLVVTHLLAAIVGASGQSWVGALGGKAVLLFLAMLLGAGLLTMLLVSPVVQLYPPDAQTVAAFRAGVSVPAEVLEASRAPRASVSDWLETLIPRNLVQAAASGEILPVLVFTVFFGLAVGRLAAEKREPLERAFRSLADAMMVLVRWILKALPVGAFVLCYALAVRAGVDATGMIAVFVALVCSVLILFTGLLYPVTALLARIPVRRFARAVAPAQLVALTTRSSLASLPALVAGARDHLRAPTATTGFVLPLSVSVFKLNRAVSATVKLLFLAHVFAIPLGPPQLAAFLVTIIVISFGIAGIPETGAYTNLPAYMAAGIPIEAVVILGAADSLADVFKTLVNVTGDMSVAAILSRGQPAGDA